MDFTGTKPIIISCGVGSWYKAGVDRLHTTLLYNGFAGDLLLYKNAYPPNCPSHEESPYSFKIYAFREAIKLGYRQILW
jgi:hypothetical protein